MSEELLVPYCRACVKNQENPTLQGYYKWLPHVSSPNYKFMCEAVFTYCLSLHIFRAGVRRNNSKAINASKVKFAPLFFGLNMPFYMETYIRDSFIRIQCPTEVLAFIEQHESYSVSGNDTKGEGGDFILEAKNRATKRLVPAGVPDNSTWLNICRNIDRLEKIQTNINEQLGLKSTDKNYSYQVDISREIFQFRKCIRNKEYLTRPGYHSTLAGKPLDDKLSCFSLKCKENLEDFLDHIVLNDISTRKKYEPIFILPEERKKIGELESRRKEELVKLVEEELVAVAENSAKKLYIKKWKKIKSQTKAMIINFLNEIRLLGEN